VEGGVDDLHVGIELVVMIDFIGDIDSRYVSSYISSKFSLNIKKDNELLIGSTKC
jgi:hypothetical protein